VEQRTRISLRRLLLLVTYVVVLLYLVVPNAERAIGKQPLSWVYYFETEMRSDNRAWVYFAAGLTLLVGTLPPFFLTRWWTIVPAVVCGLLYVLIGYEGAAHQFML
jgi:hypothetical protein